MSAGALMLLSDSEAAKYELMVAEVGTIVRAATDRPLQSSTEHAQLSELLSRGAIAAKELDALRTAVVGPMNNQVKAINALFKKVTGQLEDLEFRGKRLLTGWRDQEKARVRREEEAARKRQEEAALAEAKAAAEAEEARTEGERQAAMARAEEASREQAAAAVAAPLPLPRGMRTDSGSTFVRKRWVFEVVKPAEVPREFCTPDDKVIRAAVAAGVREIPGVSITEEEAPIVRAG